MFSATLCAIVWRCQSDVTRLGSAPTGETASVDVACDVRVGGSTTTVIAAIDGQRCRLRLYTRSGDTLTEVGARKIDLG